MSITDELRKWAKGSTLSSWTAEHLTAIADRIDAEHERAMADAYLSGTPTDEKLTELGWIRLPKDADGEPWNVGDRDEDGNVVTQLRLSSDGWYVITDGLSAFHPEQRCHYHAPTVEDVLREFAYGLGVPVADSYIAASAAKLRLAEGEDA